MSSASDFMGRLRLAVPVVQAALGSANSNAELASAVAAAGGLGGVGMRAPRDLAAQLRRARELAPRDARGALAGGLLLRHTQRSHVDALIAGQPDAAILMDGFAPQIVQRLRQLGIYVIHQVGSRADAEHALHDGADALIAQGVESGGHVLGVESGPVLLRQVLSVAQGKPVLLAGGIVSAHDVARALELGAAAAVCGSRYLLTHESSPWLVFTRSSAPTTSLGGSAVAADGGGRARWRWGRGWRGCVTIEAWPSQPVRQNASMTTFTISPLSCTAWSAPGTKTCFAPALRSNASAIASKPGVRPEVSTQNG